MKTEVWIENKRSREIVIVAEFFRCHATTSATSAAAATPVCLHLCTYGATSYSPLVMLPRYSCRPLDWEAIHHHSATLALTEIQNIPPLIHIQTTTSRPAVILRNMRKGCATRRLLLRVIELYISKFAARFMIKSRNYHFFSFFFF